MKLQALLVVCLYSAVRFGQVGYALSPDEGFKALGDWWNKTLESAAGEVIRTAGDFGQRHVGAAVADFSKFGKNTLAPALEKGVKAIENYGQEFFEAIVDEGDDGDDRSVLEVISQKAQKLPGEALKRAKEHPVQTAIVAANALTFVAPGIIAGPVSWALGWASPGPRRGTTATMIQSAVGKIGAKSAFAYLQSSAMGGYGVSAVHGVVRCGSAVIGTAAGLFGGADDPHTDGGQSTEEEYKTDRDE